MVALGGAVEKPAVLLRRRIELAQKVPRQPFHAAEGRPFKQAEALIRRSTDESRTLASRAVQEARAELKSGGYDAGGFGLLLAAGRPLPVLEQILASHALIHAAEGELYREALRDASREFGLSLTEVKEKELLDRAPRTLRLSSAELNRRLGEWGRAVGPPWRQDEKLATLVAWMALAAAS
jgi:hypothetical protein